MNRKERRAQISLTRSYVRGVNRSLSDEFVVIPRTSWPKESDPTPSAVYRSKRFLVQVYEEANGVIRLSICRGALDATGEWLARITWEELQEIKNAVGYEESDAVEIYPRASDVVNVANMRHLWILPDPLKFAWRNRTFACSSEGCGHASGVGE